MVTHRYKNGNITLKRITPLKELCLEMQNVAIALLWTSELDLELLGEQGCAGNYDMYQEFYCAYNDKKYFLLLGKAQELFDQGKTIRLYAQDMTDEDYKRLEE